MAIARGRKHMTGISVSKKNKKFYATVRDRSGYTVLFEPFDSEAEAIHEAKLHQDYLVHTGLV